MGLIGLVGPFWTRPEPPGRFYGVLAEERHLNSQGIMHGGMVMTFADHTLALASAAILGGRRQATVQLDTHFVDAVRPGDFLVNECRVVRQTHALMFMTGTLAVGTRTVALSSGVWKLRAS
jgi:acyl-coenzyme A thioesterase PaaI-like protein